jgi:hypothetical protein
VTLVHVRNPAADAAHAKAIAGDCKGALDLYDEALRHSVDASLYRDRGKCHEKLDHIYPAIEDYRTYVSEAPNATDADQVRERISELIARSSQDMAPGMGTTGGYDYEMQGGLQNGETPVVVNAHGNTAGVVVGAEASETQKKQPEETGSVAEIQYQETRDREAHTGAARAGKGFVIGAFYYPRYVFGDPYTFKVGQGVGGRLGWAFAASSTLFLEVGYMNQLSDGTNLVKDGLMTLLGYEARIPFDQWSSNQLVLAAGAGYENLVFGLYGQTYACPVGRGRVGYRHVFGPSLGLDIAVDGGFMAIIPLNNTTTQVSGAGFIGGIVALNVGF